MEPDDATRVAVSERHVADLETVAPPISGAAAERIAADYLSAHGLDHLGANWRRRFGEIDLVMRERASGTIVFVEVRYRTHAAYGGALESVDRRKRARLRNAALAWLQRHADPDDPARIDVVAVAPNIGTTADDDRTADGPGQCSSIDPVVARHGDYRIDWIVSAIEDDGD